MESCFQNPPRTIQTKSNVLRHKQLTSKFQRFMNGILKELYKHFEKKGVLKIRHILQNYMDDCGIGTLLKDFNLYVDIIHFLFDLLAHHGLHLKLSKSVFMQPQMDFLGV